MKTLILLFVVLTAFLSKNAARAAAAKATEPMAANPDIAGAPLQGFTVPSVEAGSAFDKMGLKAGDVLKSVNAVPVRSKEDYEKLPELAKTSKKLRIELVRDGKTEIFHRSNFDVKK